MAAITKTHICNLALSHLGVGKELSDVDTDVNSEASACLMYYEHALKSMLREWRWPFATQEAVLFWTNNNPTQEWGYTYMYPADCLKVRRIHSGSRHDARNTRVSYRVVRGKHTDDLDGIATSQALGVSGSMTLDGVWSRNGAYVATEGRQITVTSTGNESGVDITVVGTDRDDGALSENFNPNTETLRSTAYFKTVSAVNFTLGPSSGLVSIGAGASYGKEIYSDAVPILDSTNDVYTGPVMEYTLHVGEPSRFDYDFSIALSFRLASLIVPRITGGDSFNLAGRSIQLYQESMSLARQAAAAEVQPDMDPDSELIRARD